jgi:glycerol-3-phosphate dehydrogenase (NAD(P)+)
VIVARVGIIGAGSWGTALAKLLAENGHQVTLWSRRAELKLQLQTARRNESYLPGVLLPESLTFSDNLHETSAKAEYLLIVAPSHALRDTLAQLPALDPQCILISAVKGIEPDTGLRMSQVIAATLQASLPIVALSGPSMAIEVAQHIPTAIVAACADLEVARRVQHLLLSSYFRVYRHHDIAGVELGGALKNIIALAAGIAAGAGFGDNTLAALINRGLVEMTRLGVRLGAEAMTFAGLSGMGDLVLTCMSKKSRNRFVGEQLGQGKKLQEILAHMNMVAEGVRTTQAAQALAQKHNLEIPITREVHQVLFENKNPQAAVNELMMREAKIEKFE